MKNNNGSPISIVKIYSANSEQSCLQQINFNKK